MIQRFYNPPSIACALSDNAKTITKKNHYKKLKQRDDVEYKEKLVFYIEIDTFLRTCVILNYFFQISNNEIGHILIKNIREFQ